MKILLCHNYYGLSAPSGENQVFEAERTMLQDRGHEVETFTRHSDDIRKKRLVGALQGALATPWNPWMARAIKEEVERFQPDIVHVHNTFPLLSPAIFHAIGKSAARVLTLHNYRIFCPSAIPLRKGHICTVCIDKKSVLPALLHGCYRGSRVATFPLALSISLHRGLCTWCHQVDTFITLSDFQAAVMIEAGLPAARVKVKPNFYPGMPDVFPWAKRNSYVVYAGRLTAEKGVENLVRTWRLWGIEAPTLYILGDGNLKSKLEDMAVGLPIRFLGQVDERKAQSYIARAKLLVLPSECFEGFPMVVREAFAFGTPVAVSNIGPLPTIVRHGSSGVIFESASPESLLQQVRTVWEKPEVMACMGMAARAEYESKYTEVANYEMLMSIYEHAISISKGQQAQKVY